MPEIVEVESVARILNNRYHGSILEDVETFDQIHIKGLPRGITSNFNSILGAKINRFYRIGKHIITEFDNNNNLVTHLMMSGKFIIGKDNDKHLYVKFLIKDQEPLLFFDPRRFATMKIHLNVNHLITGIDALNGNITSKTLLLMLNKNTSEIKNFLLNAQNKIAGIGNIYASEILWHAKVNPFKICADIIPNEAEKIANSIDFILNRALKNNGSTLNDKGYKLPDGSQGKAQEFHAVYAKHGNPCKNCNNIIKKQIQKNRGTFYCSHCQL